MRTLTVTEKSSGSRLLINPAYVLMVRSIAQGGSNIYLSTGSLHMPDVVVVAEDLDRVMALIEEADISNVPPDVHDTRRGVASH
ncbi:hypothetical protein QNA08_10445 [Chelatococcus sp. SYSU_G07232]|uniref:Uncharacterized protein n=1 Tax=Chelatococcus albus TaxID=3047466 RepID=A0ABT7AGZ9_9HYPH|nr:hypothetical protein [Chelatococcus sp. SYSU_G07232]MDJ1158652.1 hypothetical protein [Chelatococcus sp. SYSU_G07232]